MENHNIHAKHNINIEVNAPCPKCKKGNLVPYLKPRYEHEGGYGEKPFDHYEIYYQCSNCGYTVEGKI